MNIIKVYLIITGFILNILIAQQNTESNIFTKNTIEIIKADIAELDIQSKVDYSPAIKTYFNHFDLNLVNVSHRFGYFLSSNNKIITHIYFPHETVGTIIILHGYLSHSGYTRDLANLLLANNYTVVAIDMIGHGLSDGMPATIDSFGTYSQIINDFMKLYSEKLPGPFHLIGHSTGASSIIDYLGCYNDLFDKIILAAPLIHSVHWEISNFGAKTFGNEIKHVPRIFRRSSSDKKYLNFVKNNDPLQTRLIPLDWTLALFEWNKKIQHFPPIKRKIFIIQGQKDIIVDYEYNIPFLHKIFPNLLIEYIPKGKHDLFNETEKIQKLVFDYILEYLKLNY